MAGSEQTGRGKLGLTVNDTPQSGDVKMPDGGYGYTAEDANRGYLDPGIKEPPEYNIENYKMRASISPDDPMAVFYTDPYADSDADFRMRDRVARGFLTRPNPPTER